MERRLYRSRKNRIVAGVAGGIGEYFDMDPVFIRVVFVLATLAGAWGLLAYVILWVVVPKENLAFETGAQTTQGEIPMSENDNDRRTSSRKHGSGMVGGITLIVLGALFLANNYMPDFDFSNTWPLILVAVGTGLILKSTRRGERGDGHEG